MDEQQAARDYVAALKLAGVDNTSIASILVFALKVIDAMADLLIDATARQLLEIKKEDR